MATVIITDNNDQDFNNFITRAVDDLKNIPKVKCAVIVAMDGEGNTYHCYHNMTLRDRVIAKQEIEFDIIDNFIKVNLDRYRSYDCEE